MLARLLPRLNGAESAIEIGAGSGTLTMPLARQLRRLTAVEPSPAMAAVLQANLTQQRLGHVAVIRRRWEEAELLPADAVIAGGCLYVFYEIEEALRKMLACAREKVLLTHVGNDGLWEIDLRAQELLGAPRPFLFPPLLMEALAFLRIPAAVELFYVKTTKRFTEEQWLRRCQRLFAVRPEQRPLLLDFLRRELHHDQDHGCWTAEEAVPAAVLELRREN